MSFAVILDLGIVHSELEDATSGVTVQPAEVTGCDG